MLTLMFTVWIWELMKLGATTLLSCWAVLEEVRVAALCCPVWQAAVNQVTLLCYYHFILINLLL